MASGAASTTAAAAAAPVAGGSGQQPAMDPLLNLQAKLVQLDNMLKTKGAQLGEADKAKLNQFRGNLISNAQAIAQARGMTLTNALAAAAAAAGQQRAAGAQGGQAAGQATAPMSTNVLPGVMNEGALVPSTAQEANKTIPQAQRTSAGAQNLQTVPQGVPSASGSSATNTAPNQNPMLSQLAAMGPEYLKHVRLLIEKNRLLESQLQNTNLDLAERERLLAQLAEVRKVQTALTSAMNRSNAAGGNKAPGQGQAQGQQGPQQQAQVPQQSTNAIPNLPPGLAGLSAAQIQQLLLQRQQIARTNPTNSNNAGVQAPNDAGQLQNPASQPIANAPVNIQLPPHIAARISGQGPPVGQNASNPMSAQKPFESEKRAGAAALPHLNIPPNKKRKKSPPPAVTSGRAGPAETSSAATGQGTANGAKAKTDASEMGTGVPQSGMPTLAALSIPSSQTTPLMGNGSSGAVASNSFYPTQAAKAQYTRPNTPSVQAPQLARPTLTGGTATLGPYMHSPALSKPPMISNGYNQDGQETIGPILDPSGAFDVGHFANTMAPALANGVKTDDAEERHQVLSRKSVQDLLKSLGAQEKIDPQVEEMILELADHFVDSVTSFACLLAKHRGSATLDVADVQLHLERNWNIRIPGFAASDEMRAILSNQAFGGVQPQLATSDKPAAGAIAAGVNATPASNTSSGVTTRNRTAKGAQAQTHAARLAAVNAAKASR